MRTPGALRFSSRAAAFPVLSRVAEVAKANGSEAGAGGAGAEAELVAEAEKTAATVGRGGVAGSRRKASRLSASSSSKTPEPPQRSQARWEGVLVEGMRCFPVPLHEVQVNRRAAMRSLSA